MTNCPIADLAPTYSPGAPVAATDSEALGSTEICPLIEMDDVPITTAIEHLARQAGVNYLVEPALMQKWTQVWEPTVNFKLRNVTAKDVLQRMLSVRGLTLLEDPASSIAFIIPVNKIGSPIFAGLSTTATNTSSDLTNIIPLIQFNDIPIRRAIELLARQAGINYMIDPKVARRWADDKSKPLISVRFENVTAWDTLNRLLNIHGLALVTDSFTHVAQITFGDGPSLKPDASLLDFETDSSNLEANAVIPLIEFGDVPLDTALENLAGQGGLRAEFDPQWKDDNDPHNQMPLLSIRWENITASQAMVALCENYNLTIARDEAAGILQIKRKEVEEHHHLPLK